MLDASEKPGPSATLVTTYFTAAKRHAGGTATASCAEAVNTARKRVDFAANMLTFKGNMGFVLDRWENGCLVSGKSEASVKWYKCRERDAKERLWSIGKVSWCSKMSEAHDGGARKGSHSLAEFQEEIANSYS